MATLGNIRKRSGLLIAIIGVALLAFLLTDLIRKGSIFRGSVDTAATINGQKIPIRDFDTRVKQNAYALKQRNPNATTMDAVSETWQQMKRQVLIDQQAEKLGLTVGEDQEWEALTANPYIRQQPFLQTDGQFDPDKFTAWLARAKNRETSVYNRILLFGERVKDQALIDGYFNLIKDGIYTSAAEAEISYHLENDKVDMTYVQIPFEQVKGEITITDDAIQTYIKEHKNRFGRPATRAIQYVSFEVKPSRSDDEAVLKRVSGMLGQRVEYNAITRSDDTLPGFKDTPNTAAFVNSQSDVNYNPNYRALSQFPKPLQSFLQSAKKGQIYGPYKVGNTYRLSRLVARAELPDSVKTRHILIAYAGLSSTPEGVERNRAQAEALADSLYTAIQGGSAFAALAKAFGEDATRDRGGELGWTAYGQFAPRFQEFAFTHKKGSMGVVETPFGFHVIEILDQKNFHPAYRVATIVCDISPSRQTENARYAQAAAFFEDTKNDIDRFSRQAQAAGLPVQRLAGISKWDARIQDIEDSRKIVKWLYAKGRQSGDSHMFNSGNGSVVVSVTGKSDKGLASVSEVRAAVAPILRKAEQLKAVRAELGGNPDLAHAAAVYHVTIRQSDAVHFGNPIVTGAGREPAVVGAAFGMRENTTAQLVLGARGIFLVKATKKTRAAASDYTGIQRRITAVTEQKIPVYAYRALVDKADIENRILELGY
ncbi:MAG: SurA N-terminal domain-containing protein [Flavobacteriales bacterium]